VAPHAPQQTVRSEPRPASDPHHDIGAEPAPRPRGRVAPFVAVIVIVGALVTGALAVTHLGPFRSPAVAALTPTTGAPVAIDVRGTWNALESYGEALDVETMDINTENLTTGAFSGTITSPVGLEIMKGTILGGTASFTITLGTSTDRGSATVAVTGATVRIQGTFSNPTGGHGTIVATRTST
jgi:hypothetical protein